MFLQNSSGCKLLAKGSQMETFSLRMEGFKEKQQFHRRETLMDSEFQNRFPDLIFKGSFKKNPFKPDDTRKYLYLSKT